MPNPDYVNVVQCLIYLDEPEQVASVLENLIKANNSLMAYQLGFDLYESATQQFLLKVRQLLKALITVAQPMDTGDAAAPQTETTEQKAETTPSSDGTKISDDLKVHIDKLLLILSGEITINANMQFLIKNNHSDLLILKTIKVMRSLTLFFSFKSIRSELDSLEKSKKIHISDQRSFDRIH